MRWTPNCLVCRAVVRGGSGSQTAAIAALNPVQGTLISPQPGAASALRTTDLKLAAAEAVHAAQLPRSAQSSRHEVGSLQETIDRPTETGYGLPWKPM